VTATSELLLHAGILIGCAAALIFIGYLVGIALGGVLRGTVIALSVVALLLCVALGVMNVQSFGLPHGTQAIAVAPTLPIPLSHLIVVGVALLLGMFLSIGSTTADLKHPLKRLRKTLGQ